MTPDEVRKLRGTASRAAFAKQVGVTPHTIYRWELPVGANDARRPRGAELERLERLRDGGIAGARVETARSRSAAAPQTEEIADALNAIERVFRDDWQAGRTELLRIVTRRTASLDARALGAAGLALIDVCLRSDPRGALATLSPVLGEADEERLSPHAAAYVYAVAACAHALPDATLFDAGRVHAHAARADELARGDVPEISFIAWLATVQVSVVIADDELLARAFARLDTAPWSELPPLLAVHEIEARSLRAMFSGQRTLAAKLNEEAAAMAQAHGYAVVEARSLALSAVRKLDELVDPEEVLVLARRSQHIARTARASAGSHMLFAARAEGEALLRAGRTDEALAALAELDVYTAETGMPPLQAITALMRAHYLTGDYDALTAIVESLRSCAVPSLRAACRANASLIEAMLLLATSDDPDATIEAFERATIEAKGWNFLLRDVLVFGCTAYLIVGREAPARAALRRAQRLLDRFPSPWASAHLRRVEGTLLAAHGHWSQGSQLLEASVGTFEAAGDLTAAALARHVLATFSRAFEEPGSSARLDESNARLASFGLQAPASLKTGVARMVERRADSGKPPRADGIERLVTPLQRLAVRGADSALVQRELIAVASELIEAQPIRLEELDSSGVARTLGGSEEGTSSSFEWVEFGDGRGRRLRIGALGPVEVHTRALLSIIAIAGSLALEVATLRNAGTAPAPRALSDDDAEIPGLIATSAAMRALRSEIVHVASSRSTVVIQGESGTGKEVVARAIHDLSTRAKLPYVAFNCAAVPRDLFEGQLFGYRKGAFTGATRDQPGVIRAAEGGTIFLDEIGELPLDVQPKLLRFLENGEIFPLGEKRPLQVDVRVVAATHRDLAALVRERRFREDLYYRLQVIVLRIPPLRDRRDDIAPLTRHFLRQLSTGGVPPILAPDALPKLTAHNWPGNVRELRNVIERALAYSPPPRVLRAEHLKLSTA